MNADDKSAVAPTNEQLGTQVSPRAGPEHWKQIERERGSSTPSSCRMKARFIMGQELEDNREGVGTFRATFVLAQPVHHSAICRLVPPNLP